MSCLYQKNSAQAWAVKNINFSRPNFGGFPKESLQKNLGDKFAFAAHQLYTKVRFFLFCDLGEEEHTRFRKKKEKKKRKPHRGL